MDADENTVVQGADLLVLVYTSEYSSLIRALSVRMNIALFDAEDALSEVSEVLSRSGWSTRAFGQPLVATEKNKMRAYNYLLVSAKRAAVRQSTHRTRYYQRTCAHLSQQTAPSLGVEDTDVRSLLEVLSDQQKHIVHSYFYKANSVREVAEQLDLTKSNCYDELQRALKRMYFEAKRLELDDR